MEKDTPISRELRETQAIWRGSWRMASALEAEKQRSARFQMGQPDVVEVFARTERDGDVARDFDAEHVLGIFRHAGGVAVAQTG